MEGKIPSQNLIRQVNLTPSGRAPGFYKPVLFDVLTVASAIFLGYSYEGYITGQLGGGIVFAALFAFTTLSALQIFFSKNPNRRFFFIVLETLGIFIFFFSYDLKILAGAAAAVLVFNFWGYLLGRSELENSLEIKFFKASWPALRKFTTALGIMLIVLYLPQLNQTNMFVSRENFKSFFDGIGGVAHNFYPSIDFTSSIGKLTEDIARLEIKNNPAFKNLGPGQKEAAIKDSASRAISDLGAKLGIAISENDATSDVFYNFIIGLLGRSKAGYQNLFLAGWAIAVFLIFRGLGVFFYWGVGLFSFLLYQVLLAGGFMYITGESRTHEVIEF